MEENVFSVGGPSLRVRTARCPDLHGTSSNMAVVQKFRADFCAKRVGSPVLRGLDKALVDERRRQVPAGWQGAAWHLGISGVSHALQQWKSWGRLVLPLASGCHTCSSRPSGNRRCRGSG